MTREVTAVTHIRRVAGTFSTQSPARGRAIWGFLRLRKPHGQHTLEEEDALRRHARGSFQAVEVGVAEGVSAAAIRTAMNPAGTLTLVDPYTPGRLFGINWTRLIARRTVARAGCAKVEWMRSTSAAAVSNWARPVDFLFLDADHSYESCLEDVRSWGAHVRPGGVMALHDARLFEGGWTRPDWGSVRLATSLFRRGELAGWRIVDEVHSLVIMRRADR
jgi:hypothetical protein